MKSCDEHIYYTVIGYTQDLLRFNRAHPTKEDLCNIECRLRVELVYWQSKKDLKKATQMSDLLREVSDKIAEMVILEEE